VTEVAKVCKHRAREATPHSLLSHSTDERVRPRGTGRYFDQDVDGAVAPVLSEPLEDGDGSCEAENGAVRSSFATTINVPQAPRTVTVVKLSQSVCVPVTALGHPYAAARSSRLQAKTSRDRPESGFSSFKRALKHEAPPTFVPLTPAASDPSLRVHRPYL
jgi:hypothetical protein